MIATSVYIGVMDNFALELTKKKKQALRKKKKEQALRKKKKEQALRKKKEKELQKKMEKELLLDI